MKCMLRNCVFLGILLLCVNASAEPLPFRRAIELALRNSTTMATATADQIRARAAYLEARGTYIPSATVGSGLAKSWGFPLSIEGSAPSVLNMNVQSSLVRFDQRQFVKAARTEWDASKFSAEDKRQLAVLDAAVAYIQLDRAATQLSLLRQEQQAAERAQQITLQRVNAGVESQVDGTRSRLNSARVRLRMAETEGLADELRTQLSQLTGLPAGKIETVTESIPAMPAVPEDADLAQKAASVSPLVKLAESNAQAREFRALGEHRALYPAIDFVGQYGLFAKYNNYEEFFRAFQRHNGVVGVVIRFNFFNQAQKAHAEAADAEAVIARKNAEDARNKVTNETLKLQRAVTQFAAARDVAQLEYQLAQANIDVVKARIQSGQGNVRDEENARLEEGDKYASYLDAAFEVEKAQMQLMRATGELDKWALR
ncbi:MAG: TolC family protein [Acidobacteriaceae bacterium]|nr:TolC family protein [Acidobacteriaceae bacterium]